MSIKLGLLGHPVEHSLSRQLHIAALAYASLDGSYSLLDVLPENLSSFVFRLVKQHWNGFNVTVPHKEAIVSLMSRLTPEAMRVGAVNTVRIEPNETMIGHNTDLGGFAMALRKYKPELGLACVIGSGGAARAVSFALADYGFKLLAIVARNSAKANNLAQAVQQSGATSNKAKSMETSVVLAQDKLKLLSQPTLLVNCTPIGLATKVVPPWFEQLFAQAAPQATFIDAVYSKSGQTILTSVASEFGISNVYDGTTMLIGQAQLAFKFWTSLVVPEHIMLSAIEHKQLQ